MSFRNTFLNKKENEALTERNLSSTKEVAIEDNMLSDVQTVQEKEKQDRETPIKAQEIQKESSTATAINTIMAVESLDKIVVNNKPAT